MKSTQLLSVVLSMILVFGVAGGSAFADEVNDDDRYDDDRYDEKKYKHDDLEDKLEEFCEMNDNERQEFIEEHPRMSEFEERLTGYCELSGDEREDALEKFIEEKMYEVRTQQIDSEMREKLENYCEMSDQEKREYLTNHEKTSEHAEKMNKYCQLDESAKKEFIEEHREEYKAHMKEKQKKSHGHKDYSKLCELTERELAVEIDDEEKMEKISKWCAMTPEEREEYKKKHHDSHNKMKKSDMSPRLKEMIMDKRSISDERIDEIKMKYKEKYGVMTEEKMYELREKIQEHISKNKIRMSDEHKSAIHERVAEMKAFKEDLRNMSSELTNEEKQQLREEFIENAKNIQLAWISPRAQINAGVDITEIECREGFNLVMKSTSGIPMCLKSDTALKMIERGLAVPAN